MHKNEKDVDTRIEKLETRIHVLEMQVIQLKKRTDLRPSLNVDIIIQPDTGCQRIPGFTRSRTDPYRRILL